MSLDYKLGKELHGRILAAGYPASFGMSPTIQVNASQTLLSGMNITIDGLDRDQLVQILELAGNLLGKPINLDGLK